MHHSEWRDGHHIVHLSLQLVPLPDGESVIPLGRRPRLLDTSRWLAELAQTTSDLSVVAVNIGQPIRTIEGDARVTITFSVTRTGSTLVDVVSRAADLERVLDEMTYTDQSTYHGQGRRAYFD